MLQRNLGVQHFLCSLAGCTLGVETVDFEAQGRPHAPTQAEGAPEGPVPAEAGQAFGLVHGATQTQPVPGRAPSAGTAAGLGVAGRRQLQWCGDTSQRQR